jgi:hypothetical protein
MRLLKRTLDPHGILNPGKVFPWNLDRLLLTALST